MGNEQGASASGWPAARIGSPEPSHRHKDFGDPVKTWEYLSADGERIGYVSRYERPYPNPDVPDRAKTYSPQTYDGKHWRFKKWAGKQPLYGLDLLAERPTDWVIVCEGEKSADAARLLVPGALVTTAPGGWGQWKYADWSPLYGRKGVIIWPDADKPGYQVAAELAAHLAAHGVPVKAINVKDQAEGWDAANAIEEGHTAESFKAWSKPRTKLYKCDPVSPWDTPDTPQRPSTERTPRPAAEAKPAPERSPFPEPMDLFARPLLPRLQPEQLPRALRDYVFDQSALIGSDPGILAMSSIVAVAGAANDNIRLRMKQHDEGWTERPCLWGAWIAGPGARKSPAQRRAIKILRDIDHEWSEQYAKELKSFEIDKRVHKEIEAKHIKARAKALLDRGAYSSLGDAPDPPKNRRLLADDVTIEALAGLLADNPRGIVMPFDELSGWFGAMDAYRQSGVGSKDRAKWLEAYEGGKQRIDRVSRPPIIVPNWSICVMGGIQPDAMRGIAAKLPEDGLMQRFMVTMAEDAIEDEDRPYNAPAKRRYTAMIEHLAQQQAPPQPIRMSGEAIQEFRWISDEARGVAKLSVISPRMKAHLGKIDGLFGRLAIVYHLADAADRGIPPPPEVTGKTAETVADFMRGYLAGHLRAFYDDLLTDSRHRVHATWIAGHILGHELDQLEHRRLLQNYRGWDALPEWTQTSALRMLEDAGWLYPIHTDNPGRRVTRWEVNPLVHERFARHAEREAQRRKEETNGIRATAFGRALTGER